MREVVAMSDQNWTAQDLRRALIEKANEGKAGAPPETLSAPTRRMAMALANYIYYWTPDDDVQDIEDDEMYQLMMSRLETLTAFDSVRSGDVSSMRGVSGNPRADDDVDTSSWRAADILKSIWHADDRNQMLNLVVFGPPTSLLESNTGSGKTDFTYTLVEAGQRAYDEMGETLQAASNNHSDPYHTVGKWSEAAEWMESTDGPKVLVLDEAAQGLMYADMSSGRVLSRKINLMRKHNCHLILISHTGKDIPKDVRRKVVWVQKESQKTAVLGNTVTNAEGDALVVDDDEYRLTNIPPTTVDYESIDDKGEFEWDDVDGDEASSDEVAPQCRVTLPNDDRCPNDAKLPSDNPLVCKSHRNKMEDIQTNGSDDDQQQQCQGVTEAGRCGLTDDDATIYEYGEQQYCGDHRDQYRNDAPPAYKRSEKDGSQDSAASDPTPDEDRDGSSSDLIHK